MFWVFSKVSLRLFFGKALVEYGQVDVDKALNFIQQIQLIHQKMQEQLELSQPKYKEIHGKHRVDQNFQVGNQVWIHISKY